MTHESWMTSTLNIKRKDIYLYPVGVMFGGFGSIIQKHSSLYL